MVKYQTVRAADLDVKKLTFEDLRYLHGTGRSYVISGTGHDRKTGYRTGVQTNVGDIEVSEWKELMKELIHPFRRRSSLSEIIPMGFPDYPVASHKARIRVASSGTSFCKDF